MGWAGYTIYSGDGTQTCHYNFISWSGIKVPHETICDDGWLGINKTKIPNEHLETFKRGLSKVIKKMPKKRKYWRYEDDAMDWHMLLALCIDNKVKPPKIVYDLGIAGAEFLMGEHASEFDYPSRRRQNLRNFIKRAKKLGWTEQNFGK